MQEQNKWRRKTRGKPADQQIYLEAAHIHNPGLEAHFDKFNYLIRYLARGSKVNNCSG